MEIEHSNGVKLKFRLLSEEEILAKEKEIDEYGLERRIMIKDVIIKTFGERYEKDKSFL